MESRNQAIRVISAINKVVVSLIGKEYVIACNDNSIAMIEERMRRMKDWCFQLQDIADERIIDVMVYSLYLKRKPMRKFTAWDVFSDMTMIKFQCQFMSENGKSGMNYYINKWLREANLTRTLLTKMIAKPKPHKMSKFIYLESDEMIKKRFYNTEIGYLLCQQSTTGWAPRSRNCKFCENADKCMIATEQKYPELVRLRIKDYENEKD